MPSGRVLQSADVVRAGKAHWFGGTRLAGRGAGYGGAAVHVTRVFGIFLVCVPVEHSHTPTTVSNTPVSNRGRGVPASMHDAEPRNIPPPPPPSVVRHPRDRCTAIACVSGFRAC